jgi:hypothetical protein
MFDQVANYERKTIRTRAFMAYSTVAGVDGGDTFIYSQNCNSKDYFSVIDFSKLKKAGKWNNFFAKLPKEKDFIFEIDFTGTMQLSITPTFGHLSWSLAEIKIVEISSIKDVTFVSAIKKPDYKADAHLSDKGTSLRNINSEILFYFMSSNKMSSLPNLEQYISHDFILIDKLGRKFDKKDYRILIKEGLFSAVIDSTQIVSDEEIKKLEDEIYTISGEIGISFANEKREKLNYKNTFQFSENAEWKLIETKFFEN